MRDTASALATAPVPAPPAVERPLDSPLSVVLFSGTDDRLEAASVLVAGAAAMGRPVHVFLQYWGLDAFRADRIGEEHGLAPESTLEGAEAIWRWKVRRGGPHWSETLRQAKDLGGITVHACALSMETFGLSRGDLDPLVDGVEGVAAFMAGATGPVLFV